MPHFKAFDMMILQYEIRIYNHKIHYKSATYYLKSGTDVTSGPVIEDKKDWAFFRISIYVFLTKFLEKQVWPDISSPTDLFNQICFTGR